MRQPVAFGRDIACRLIVVRCSTMIIDLTKPGKLPEEFVARLKCLESLCREFEFSDVLVGRKEVYFLVKDIDEFCATQKVVVILTGGIWNLPANSEK